MSNRNRFQPLKAGLGSLQAPPSNGMLARSPRPRFNNHTAHSMITRTKSSVRSRVSDRLSLHQDDPVRYPLPSAVNGHYRSFRAAQTGLVQARREQEDLRVKMVEAIRRWRVAKARADKLHRDSKRSLHTVYRDGRTALLDGSWDKRYVASGAVRPTDLPPPPSNPPGKLRRAVGSFGYGWWR